MKWVIKLLIGMLMFPVLWTIGALYLLVMLAKGMYASFVTK